MPRGSIDRKQLKATITLTIVVHFEEVDGKTQEEAALQALDEAVCRDYEGVLGEIIEPSVDAIEEAS